MKVLQSFTCKVTGKRYEAGSDYDGQRGDELAAKGFVEAVEKEKQEQTHIPKHEIEVEPTKKRTRRK